MKQNQQSAAPPSIARENSEFNLRARLNIRTHELAQLAGRPPPYVTQRDYERAKEDITGETDLDLQNAILDAPAKEVRHGSAVFMLIFFLASAVVPLHLEILS